MRRQRADVMEGLMGRAAILWLLGIPIPILLLMWVFGWLG
jgi:hypothetical protein